MKVGTHVGSRSWQKETRLRNMFWSVGCRGIGLCDTTAAGDQWGEGWVRVRISLILGVRVVKSRYKNGHG